METNGTEENGSKNVDVLRIQVVPSLAISIKSAATVHVDVCSAQLEKGGGVLEDLLESVRLPVIGVVGELNVTLDVYCSSVQKCKRRRTLKHTDIDVLQKGQVERGSNHIGGTLGEDDVSTVVALVDGSKNVFRVVSLAIIVALHIAVSVSRRRLGERLVWLLWTKDDRRSGSLVLGDRLWQGLFVLLVGCPGR